MAAEFIAEGERPFEIDAPPLPPRAERGARERFVGDIDGKARAFALCLGDIDDGEAAAVASDRSPLFEAPAFERAANDEARARPLLKRSYAADNAGEHHSTRRHQL